MLNTHSAVNKSDEEFISLWEMKKTLKLNSVSNSIDSMNKKILPKVCPINKEEEFDKFDADLAINNYKIIGLDNDLTNINNFDEEQGEE